MPLTTALSARMTVIRGTCLPLCAMQAYSAGHDKRTFPLATGGA
jgi:hypothetical protein